MQNYIWLKFRFKLNGLIRFVYHSVIKYSKDSRPSSYPYISGDGFRKFADHVFEDKKTFNADQTVQKNIFNAEDVKQGDVVFLDARSIFVFFNEFHPKIKNKYILISHNADVSIGVNEAKLVDEKIIKWFGQNVNISHPKIIPIPIGLENLYYYNNGIISYFNNLKKIIVNKKNEILFGFNVNTNPAERIEAKKVLQHCSVCKEIGFKLNSINYLKLLNNYKFVASPPGNGLDCHRTWEAMCLRVIPIVKRSVAMDYFFSIGIPLWIIDDWSEIVELKELTLEKKYNDLRGRFNCKALFMDYWFGEIKRLY